MEKKAPAPLARLKAARKLAVAGYKNQDKATR